MTAIQILYLVGLFVVASGSVFLLLRWLMPPVMSRRMRILLGDAAPVKHASPLHDWLVRLSTPVARLSAPRDASQGSALRLRFYNAGYRQPSALIIFFGAKTVLAFALPLACMAWAGVLGGVTAGGAPAVLVALSAIGYYLPNALLNRRIALRQRELFENFPDAMDLVTVCVEAGLALDAALARAGEEMRLKSATLADEFNLVTLELRAGATRDQALRNLALRTGVEEIGTFVAMILQAERFGTNVADSLRVLADTLRTRRRLRAEEAAAKVPLKLLFPLIFCIFPSLLLVLLGPAYISISHALLPALAGP